MAHFLGAIKGGRGEVTRLGTKNSGLDARAQGWDIGARVYCYVDAQGRDCVRVELTRGSNARGHNMYLGDFALDADGKFVQIADGWIPSGKSLEEKTASR